MRKQIIVALFFSLAFFSINKTTIGQNFKKSPDVDADSLQTMIHKANKLWASNKGDLELATNLLSFVTDTSAVSSFWLAQDFYLHSIKNSSFTSGKNAVTQEVHRMIPIIPDSLKERWPKYLSNKNPKIFTEIIRFWQTHDPFVSTKLNERLIEHWKRINYARDHYKTGSKSKTVNNFDDRGLYHVKYGPPNSKTTTNITLGTFFRPSDNSFITQLSDPINLQVRIWNYSLNGEEVIFVFGENCGFEGFGVCEGLLELVGPKIRFTGSNRRSIVQRETGRNAKNYGIANRDEYSAIKYEILKQLAPYHPIMQYSLNRANTKLNITGEFQSLNDQLLANEIRFAPSSKTSTKTENEILSVKTKKYRFLNEKSNSKVLYVVKVNPSIRPQYANNIITVFDKKWNLVLHNNEYREIMDVWEETYLYTIENIEPEQKAFFTTELIDTTQKISRVSHLNPNASMILKSSEMQNIELGDSLNKQPLQTSDIVIGKEQEIAHDNTFPFQPSIDPKFDQEENIMVYFEVYDIPQKGYRFTYRFKKKKWLWGYKKVEDKSAITIRRENSNNIDSQTFSIDQQQLSPDQYKLVIEVEPIDSTLDIGPKTREIDFQIVE